MRPRGIHRLLAFACLALLGWGRPLAAQDKPLTWQECVDEAAARNPDVIAAQDVIRKSRATVGASRSDYFPQLTPNAGFQGSNSANNSNFNPNAPLDIDTGPRKQFTVGVTLEQNIFEGFKTGAGLNKSKAQLTDAEANLIGVKSQVSAELKTAFARVLFGQSQIEVDKKIVERRQDNVRFVALKFEGGRENQGSLLRNQALLDQAKFNLSETQRALRVAQRDLARVLGRDYSQATETIKVKGSFKAAFPSTPPDIPALTAQHPDHRKAEAQVDVGKQDVRLAKGDLYPSIDATASASDRIFIGNNDNFLWSAGVNLQYPFFTGGRDLYEVKSARAEQYRLQEVLRSTDNKTALTLKQSYADFHDAVENIRVQEKFLKSAEVRAEIARSQYANGLLSYQDWDLIENDLIDSQRTILESLRDALIAEANWEKAQGIGAIP